jgi:hypothetical protein
VSAHTPGPWDNLSGTFVSRGLSAQVAATVKTEHGLGTLTVATVGRGVHVSGTIRTTIDEAQAIANARLIASAPDLLAVVERIVTLRAERMRPGFRAVVGFLTDDINDEIDRLLLMVRGES